MVYYVIIVCYTISCHTLLYNSKQVSLDELAGQQVPRAKADIARCTSRNLINFKTNNRSRRILDGLPIL